MVVKKDLAITIKYLDSKEKKLDEMEEQVEVVKSLWDRIFNVGQTPTHGI